MSLIIVILSKFRTKLLAANHSVVWGRTGFDTEQKSSKFLLDILTLVSLTNIIDYDIQFILRRKLFIYTVWQKINETGFLLTMNFILFTNQGYPLRNSFLGQLHSNGGVVSIVRSSARRLLLEYLSARWLRSSGYYSK